MAKEYTYLKDENVLTLFSLNNLIVPEIQREYVWGNNSNNVLSNFLNDIKNKAGICAACHYAHSSENISVGFLYSYKPPYVEIESSRFLDEYLIDGQQRITTLFLLLMCRSVIENRRTEFLNICRMNDSLESCFKYKVRYKTQRFLYDLVNHAVRENDGCLERISQSDYPNWYLSDYRQDPTIQSMINAISLILEIFPQKDCYFDYILKNIHFWHFKTEATSQGEELYITMNSRGASLTTNETIKAHLLPLDEQVEWGEKWESWQQFFWKKRGDNENADKGFNEYLACINGLERFRQKEETINLVVNQIEPYINALFFLFDDAFSNKVKELYPNCYSWFDNMKNDILNILNLKTTDWNLSFDEKIYNNQSASRNNAILMWSWMYYYCKAKEKNNQINESDFIRVLHLYYIKYHVNNRGVKRIWELIDSFVDCGYMNQQQQEEGDNDNKGLTEEEIKLESLYNKAEDRNSLESTIWKIQDISFIKNGKDVGADTIGKYLDIIEVEESAISFLNNIHKLLPEEEEKKIEPLIKKCLLFYAPNDEVFWHRSGPWYYDKYDTTEKKRIFRSQSFHSFYKENLESLGKAQNVQECLKNILNKKRKEFFSDTKYRCFDYDSNHILNHRELTILYDILFNEDGSNKLWDRDYIAYYQEDVDCPRFFKIQRIPYSLKNTFRSDDYKRIDLPPDWQAKLERVAGVKMEFKNYPT